MVECEATEPQSDLGLLEHAGFQGRQRGPDPCDSGHGKKGSKITLPPANMDPDVGPI